MQEVTDYPVRSQCSSNCSLICWKVVALMNAIGTMTEQIILITFLFPLGVISADKKSLSEWRIRS